MIVNKDFVEIYFDDLNEDAQEFLRKRIGDPKKHNLDVHPIAVVPIPEQDG